MKRTIRSSALLASLAILAACGAGSVLSVAPGPTPTSGPSGTSTSTPGPPSTQTPGSTPTPASSPTPAALAVFPSALTFDATTNATQSATITDGTPGPYTASGCTSIVTATVSGNSVTVTGAAAGACTLTISDSGHHTRPIAITVTTVSVPIQ